MAKDDYYVIVGKILIYLYARLKKKTDKGIEYLSPNTEDFPIDWEYWDFVLKSLYERGLIDGVSMVSTPSGHIVNIWVTDNTHITVDGIDYLQDNSKIKKVLDLIPMASLVAGLFI